MQRTERRPERSELVASMVIFIVGSTLFGWLMFRGSYVAGFLVAISFAAADTIIMFSRWDWALVLRRGGDERQKHVADRAGRTAFLAILATCLLGAELEMGTGGDPGTFALIAGVAIAAYLVTVAVLVRRS